MVENCAETFIRKNAVDTRTTVFKITEHNGRMPHFDGMVQDELLKVQFLSFIQTVYDQFTENITVVNTAELEKGIVKVSCADLYKESSFSSGIVTQAFLGTIVDIIDEKNGWMFVQLPDGYLGWVNETIVRADTKKIIQWSNFENLLFVHAFHAAVFDPETTTEYVGNVFMGNVLLNNGRMGSFYNVDFPDCRKGLLSVDSAMSLIEWKKVNLLTQENIVTTAKRLIGIPYVWGGCSSKGLDCSGFTKLTYFMNGYQLPRDADQQAKTGMTVDYDRSYSSLQPGDLLFFGRRADGSVDKREGDPIPVSHVGLSLGGALFIQASGDVHKSSLDPSSSIFDKLRSESLQLVKQIIK
ncbi:MAG: C40 family peptidase [Fibrobacter sp.]|nr:C40 family peptidase [Fibrobacter sp.]